MTEFDIASAIKNYVTSHEGVTNFKPSIDQIRDEVDTLRIRLLTELEIQNRYVFTFDEYYQNIEIKTSYDVVNKMARGVIPLVHFTAKNKPAVQYIGSLKGDTPHKLVTGNDRYWAQHSPYTGNMATVVYEDGNLEFLSKNVPKKIRVRAVFRRPSDCRKYNDYNWQESEYPVPNSLLDVLIGKTAESYLRTMYRIYPQPNTQSDMPRGAAK